jgi:hypothetical protein
MNHIFTVRTENVEPHIVKALNRHIMTVLQINPGKTQKSANMEKTTSTTYRKAAKAARVELAETLRGMGIDPERANFETTKIFVRCFCGQKREAAKATALYYNTETGGTNLAVGLKSVCNCKAEK